MFVVCPLRVAGLFLVGSSCVHTVARLRRVLALLEDAEDPPPPAVARHLIPFAQAVGWICLLLVPTYIAATLLFHYYYSEPFTVSWRFP